ncbi:MAG TPA: homoserine dehydrogenase, partial [bacterium]|nr:homoserine dehydrogenase [bacterium]
MAQTKKLGVGIIGFGTVGSGVARILLERGDRLAEKTGLRVELRAVCDSDLRRKRPVSLPPGLLSSEIETVLENPAVDVVAELVGGLEPAGSLIVRAFRNGKSVVTANKALLAERGDRLFAAAREHGVRFGFEAAVGGAIPIIRALRESFVSNRVTSLYGILNGTTNFILTRMEEECLSLEGALKIAQANGFAERDPSLDLSGQDASHKLS